ncbi:hypothetical protein B0T21DRAFT_42424 [Apiosordaria backusii]|uniref:Secreted protein n=1 Tax=Apiosordaria backusii TaxID=314023 RepID=A0AA40E1M9_9PEZI|nr:hypothetical protein B0T21DRAFT_42424 [Apiosordaria backusii]
MTRRTAAWFWCFTLQVGLTHHLSLSLEGTPLSFRDNQPTGNSATAAHCCGFLRTLAGTRLVVYIYAGPRKSATKYRLVVLCQACLNEHSEICVALCSLE